MVNSGLRAGLEWVLMASFGRGELEALVLPGGVEAEVSRWPSCFYAWAAERVLRSEPARRRVSTCLEARLQPFLGRHRGLPPIELAEVSRAAADTHGAREMAAVLWIFSLRAQPSTDLLCRRLVREAELIAARRLGASLGIESHLGAQGSPEADRLSAIG